MIRSRATSPAPAARRLHRVRWRDLRLWLGLALIVGSMVVGSRVLSASQESVTAWRAARDLAPGSVPQLEPVTMPLGPVTGAYATGPDVPEGRMRLAVPAGALVPAAAIAPSEPAGLRLVTVAVDPLHAPAGLAAGDVVDVWHTPAQDTTAIAGPRLVRGGVLVAEALTEAVGMGGEIPVVLEVPEAAVADVVTSLRTGVIDLVRVPLSEVES